jgi:hypothetical protein
MMLESGDSGLITAGNAGPEVSRHVHIAVQSSVLFLSFDRIVIQIKTTCEESPKSLTLQHMTREGGLLVKP